MLIVTSMVYAQAAETQNIKIKDNIKQNLQKNLAPFFGPIKKENIFATDFNNVAEVIIENPVISMFVSSNGKYLIQGDIIDLKKHTQMQGSSRLLEIKKSIISKMTNICEHICQTTIYNKCLKPCKAMSCICQTYVKQRMSNICETYVKHRSTSLSTTWIKT